MRWTHVGRPEWTSDISNRAAKEAVAARVAAFAADGQVIGIGSGSTSFLALLALADRVHSEGLQVRCVATSQEIAGYCSDLGLDLTTLVDARPDWCFDGADEVDQAHNLLKGRGGAFVREKLVFAAAGKRYILVDASKFVDRLGEHFAVPLEVIPEAIRLVEAQLRETLGVVPTVRPAGGKDGGVITEQGGLVMDLPLPAELVAQHSASELELVLNNTVGITGTGLFTGFDLEVISDS